MSRSHSIRGWLALGIVGLLAAPALAQGQAAQPLTVKQLKSNVYVAEGGGGNSGIIIGNNGVIVVDAKVSPAYGTELIQAVEKLTPKKITTVILTHSDGDHVNGLASFPRDVTIIAHENDRKELDAAVAKGGRGAPPAGHLPNKLVKGQSETLTIDGVKVALHHWAPAHTSGDLVVYLPSAQIVFTGDIVATQLPDAIIHLEKHGSSAGWVTTMKGILGLRATQFVPGHGDVQTRAQIEDRLKSTEAERAKVMEMAKAGKSIDDIQAALGQDAAAGAQRPRFPSFAEVVYREVMGGSK